MGDISRELSKLRMLGLDILAFNDWAIIYKTNTYLVVRNALLDSVHKIDITPDMHTVLLDNFALVKYLGKSRNPTKKIFREALFAKYCSKDLLSRMSSGRYYTRINTTDTVYKQYRIIDVRKSGSLDIILFNEYGKRLSIGSTPEASICQGILRRSEDDTYYFVDYINTRLIETATINPNLAEMPRKIV